MELTGEVKDIKIVRCTRCAFKMTIEMPKDNPDDIKKCFCQKCQLVFTMKEYENN